MNVISKSILIIAGLGMIAGCMLSKDSTRRNARRAMENAKHNAKTAVDKAKRAYAEHRANGGTHSTYKRSGREQELLDEGLVESFPASDSVSVARVD